MTFKGPEAYNDDAFFQTYHRKRSQKSTPNLTLEEPIIDELITPIAHKDVLDLGCGTAQYGKLLLDRGANSYHGIDGSSKMLQMASTNLMGSNHRLECALLEEVNLIPETYDRVISRLVLHYLERLAYLFSDIYRTLKPEGQFIFSVEHPIITSNYESAQQQPPKRNWIVDQYFHSGPRVHHWMNLEVVKYHRTLEDYVRLVKDSGLIIQEIRESKPKPENFDTAEEYTRRMRIPLFLIIKATKMG